MNTDCVSGKPISERRLPERFASPDYQILLVANKYQTGFDQPLLCAMYVDKRVDGVQAVQTLSRLNRMIPGKENPFVLDFVNEAEDIYRAFKPYYDATSLQESSDPQRLEKLKHELDGAQIYFQSEVEAFARIFYKPVTLQSPRDHAGMLLHLPRSRSCRKRFTTRYRRRTDPPPFKSLYRFIQSERGYRRAGHPGRLHAGMNP